MSNLNSIFDILRGYPFECALCWDFTQDSGAASDIEEGTVVAVTDDGGTPAVDRHTSALIGSNPDQPWIVIRGKDQEDAQFTGKLTCLKMRTGILFRVPTALTPTVGDLVWANNGALTLTDPAGGERHVGKVVEFDADEDWMVIES